MNSSFDLVTLSDGDIAHVVAEACDFEVASVMPCTGSPRPGADFVVHGFIIPKTDHDLRRSPHTSTEEPELSIAMGGLVQVHEIHVDGRPGEILVKLGVEVQKRFIECA